MISSLDTYVYSTLESMIPKVLKEDNLVRQTLMNVDEEAREKFITNFCGSNPKQEVGLSYSFPEKKINLMAILVIQSGSSSKVGSSLGGVESTFNYGEDGLVKEHGRIIEEVPEDPTKLKISLNHPIGEIQGVDKISFSLDEDQPYIQGSDIYFNKKGNEYLINLFGGVDEEGKPHNDYSLTVTYNKLDESRKGSHGANIGYTAKETVGITPMSVNMDTARCLDVLIHTLLVVMSQNVDEQSTYLLQDFKIGEMQQLAFEFDNTGSQTVYGRPITVEYQVSNTINYYYEKLKNIVFPYDVKEAYDE